MDVSQSAWRSQSWSAKDSEGVADQEGISCSTNVILPWKYAYTNLDYGTHMDVDAPITLASTPLILAHGVNCCRKLPVCFHYVFPAIMAIVYNLFR